MGKIILIGLIFSVLLLSGCINQDKVFDKEGIVYKIEYDMVVGGTYTDWMHFVYFNDGSVFACRRTDKINLIELNRTGVYTLQERFYDKGDGYIDEYYELVGVKYQSLEI